MKNNTKEIYNLIRLNKFDEAEKLVISLIKNRGGNSEYNFIYGLILVQKKDILNAYKNFKISADKKNSSYDSNFNCGNCLQLLMRYDEAIKNPITTGKNFKGPSRTSITASSIFEDVLDTIFDNRFKIKRAINLLNK